MNVRTKLSKAIAHALAGVALSAGAITDASAGVTTIYNLTTAGAADNSTNTTDPTTGGVWDLYRGNTDGWIYGDLYPAGDPTNTVAKWAGTTGTNHTPFGYTAPHLNWAVQVKGGGTGEISTFDSFARYGVYADIDTARGAWSDVQITGGAGWRHDLDVGLFKSDISGLVTLSAQGILESNSNFAFTIFKGMSTNSDYNHYGPWNAGNNTTGLTNNSLIRGGTTFTTSDIVAYTIGGTNPSNINTISFQAAADQIYTVAIGGYRNGSWVETTDGYRLTVSQVPVPGAVWLFGSALAGFVGVARRKRIAM
jgi:hypothetical protein